jgi:hypothetical protein
MDRTHITAAVVEEIDRRLAQRETPASIASRLKVSPYVVEVVAGDEERTDRPQPHDLFHQRAPNASRGVDASTIRMIRRMLDAGMLGRRQIAREAQVSLNIIEQMVAGRRLATSTGRPIVFKDLGERFLKEPIRCLGCGAMIAIAPCRACRALAS